MSSEVGVRIIRIGLDDTDHPKSGCTTESFDDLLHSLDSQVSGFKLIERRLVRLWPFAARRTRGNGALSAIIQISSEQRDIFDSVCQKWFEGLLRETAVFPSSPVRAAPVLLISERDLPEEWYWSAVREHVELEPRLREIRSHSCVMHTGDESWGAVGASAAMAWQPNEHSTWELISWRDESMIGKSRMVSSRVVREMEKQHPETFVNRDPTVDRGLIAPRTPCPVLYGIRGSTAQCVEDAHRWLQSRNDVEQSLRWAVHRTNQLSDDHVRGVSLGTVITLPMETKGAHSHISVFSEGIRADLVAFSEGGPVNKLFRRLVAGDRIAWVGLNSPDGSVHLERLAMVDCVPRVVSRPSCCGRTMRSAGAGQTLRCQFCGSNAERTWVSQDLYLGDIDMVDHWSEPHPSNRRHLARPLQLSTPKR